MLAVAALVILAVAEPFAQSLVATGEQLHVSQFLLVQWVAPSPPRRRSSSPFSCWR